MSSRLSAASLQTNGTTSRASTLRAESSLRGRLRGRAAPALDVSLASASDDDDSDQPDTPTTPSATLPPDQTIVDGEAPGAFELPTRSSSTRSVAAPAVASPDAIALRADHHGGNDEHVSFEPASPGPSCADVISSSAFDTENQEGASTLSGGSSRTGRTKIFVDGFEYTRANVTQRKITYRCSFYRSQECPARLVYYAALMDYDFANAVAHTCNPPARAAIDNRASASTMWVKFDMQRDVDSLAVAGSQTPLQIWAVVRAKYYNQGENVVVRGLTKPQVLKRVHRTRALHFGSDMHGRVKVPPLSRVLNSSMNVFQFHHV